MFMWQGLIKGMDGVADHPPRALQLYNFQLKLLSGLHNLRRANFQKIPGHAPIPL